MYVWHDPCIQIAYLHPAAALPHVATLLQEPEAETVMPMVQAFFRDSALPLKTSISRSFLWLVASDTNNYMNTVNTVVDRTSSALRNFWQIFSGWWPTIFSPRKLGKIFIHFNWHIFQRGWFNHQLVSELSWQDNSQLQELQAWKLGKDSFREHQKKSMLKFSEISSSRRIYSGYIYCSKVTEIEVKRI